MALDKLVDSTALDNGLTTVADAIRTKGGTTAQLAFPQGMADAIAAIPSGGTEPQKYISFEGNNTISKNVNIPFIQSVPHAVEFDWGDGTTDTYDGTGDLTATHNMGAGDFLIKMSLVGDGYMSLGSYQTIEADKCIIGSDVGFLPGSTFRDSKFKEIYFENGCSKFDGRYNFYNSLNLTKVTLPVTLVYVDESQFLKGGNLKKVSNIDGDIQFNGAPPVLISTLFCGADRLTSIELPEGMVEIQGNSIRSCENLKRCVFPTSLKTIDSGWAFYGPFGDVDWIFKSALPPTIPNNSWSGSQGSNRKYIIPYDYVTAYSTATNWTLYTAYFAGWGEFKQGAALPAQTTDGAYNLTWYANTEDLRSGANAITTAPTDSWCYCAFAVAQGG